MRCFSAEDVADLDKTFSPVSRTVNSECERVEHEFSPQRLKWRLQCTGQVDMDVAGEFIFETPEHYTGVVTARSSMMGHPMQDVRTEIDGQLPAPAGRAAPTKVPAAFPRRAGRSGRDGGCCNDRPAERDQPLGAARCRPRG